VGCSPRVIAALRENLDAARLAVYPEYGEAKEAVARYFNVAPEQFVFTNGTDEAIQVFVNAYVDDAQEVLLVRPSYAMYRFYAEVAGARIKEIDYPQPSMEFPLQQVLDAITAETRAVILANPNNPTGTGISLLAIERILHKAHRAVVMVDEAYYEFSGVTALGEIERVPNLFVSRTFSKVFGMAAMRLGCLFSHAANVALLHKAQSPYSVNSLAALAAQAAVEDTAYVESYVAEALAARELLCLGLEKLGIAYVPSSANFVLGWFGRRAIEVRDALRGRGILVRDRSYEAAGAVRITVGTREQTRRLLAALEEIWKK
jgi:histidinol-phosphate aminotransferase